MLSSSPFARVKLRARCCFRRRLIMVTRRKIMQMESKATPPTTVPATTLRAEGFKCELGASELVVLMETGPEVPLAAEVDCGVDDGNVAVLGLDPWLD